MPSEKEKQCMICSGIIIIVCAIVIPIVVTQVAKRNPNDRWILVGDPLWTNHSGLPNGNIAFSDTGELLLLVEFNQPNVGIFDLHVDDSNNQEPSSYSIQSSSSSNSIPAPIINLTDTFQQVASMSGDGKTIAIGHPEEQLVASDDAMAKGYVSVYEYDNNQTWTLKGNHPSFWDVMEDDNDSAATTKTIYTGGYFGAATALSQDGNRLAIGITQVQGFSDPNTTNSFFHSSYVQVMQFSQEDNQWEKLGPRLEGTCSQQGSTGCVPCQGSFGSGEIDFGITLSFNSQGSRLAVGAPQVFGCNSEQSLRGGFVRVFDFNSEAASWEQVGADIVELDFNDAEHAFAPREFGLSVSLAATAGNRLAVGSNAGALILDLNETAAEWEWNDDFKWSTKSTFENFKSQVSLTSDGNRFAFGGPESQANGGRVDTYEWMGNDKGWDHYGRTIAGNIGFGSSIALSANNGNLLAIKGGFDTTVYQAP